MLRYLLALIILLHGLLHLMGFSKAFGYGNTSQLSQHISKPLGVVWLLTAILFIAACLLFLLKKDHWWLPAIGGVVLSQCLLFTVWHEAKFGTIANVIVLFASVAAFGAWQYYRTFRKDIEQNLHQVSYFENSVLTEEDMAHLPEPVKKYLRFTKAVGKPKVNNFKVEFTGKIRKNEQSAWMPFTSEQYNYMAVPTRLFFMKARMKQLPVGGYHRYVNGKATMDIRLFSLFKVQYLDGDEMNRAETVTFFNDMCFMAPPTLIDKRITWLETKGNTVKAAFTNNGVRISAILVFDDRGALVNFFSDDRYAAEAGKRLCWSTPTRKIREINGYWLGTAAEAIYRYPDRNLVYGTFTLTRVVYNVKGIDEKEKSIAAKRSSLSVNFQEH